MSKGTYSHSNRHRMHEEQDVPFVITEARRIGKGFWKEMQAYRQTVDELQKENEELKKKVITLREKVKSYWCETIDLNQKLDQAFDAGFELEDDE